MTALERWYVREEAPTVVHRRRPADLVKERRAAVRLPIEIDVDVEGAAHRFRTTTANISAGGMFVATTRDIPVGTNVMLSFALPNGATHELIGVVQWKCDGDARGFGVSFFCLDPAVKKSLEHFCAVREALYSSPESGEYPTVIP
jgi:uncharacterized protein (TIGR02266 family)